MTHDRCSELLGPYVRGELAPGAADEVRAHLAACDDCRMEERAVAALFEEVPRLDDVERARLHRALAQEIGPAAANADVVASTSAAPRWARWIAPAAGAAAVIAALAYVGLAGGLTGGGDDSAESGASMELRAPARGEGRDAFEDADDAGGAGGGSAADAAQVPAADAEPQRGDAERSSLYANGPAPVFDRDAGSLDAAELSEKGRSGDVFTSFASAYSIDDAPELQEASVAQLADASGAAAPEVRECARTMPPDDTVVAVYGATGEYEGRDALVLGFVTSESGERFDRYLMWVWARGDCEHPVDTLIGDIET